jgi:hypothetical protein
MWMGGELKLCTNEGFGIIGVKSPASACTKLVTSNWMCGQEKLIFLLSIPVS